MTQKGKNRGNQSSPRMRQQLNSRNPWCPQDDSCTKPKESKVNPRRLKRSKLEEPKWIPSWLKS
eukprot:9240065-Karenia_brevis.AAC.1